MAHPDMDALLDEGLQIAIHFLEKNGEFYPFGVTMAPDGSIAHTQGYTGDENPPSQELIELLLRGFQSGATSGDYRATALISDVRVSLNGTTKTEAICVTVEHQEDPPVTCLLPYAKTDAGYEFGELIAQRADSNVFPR